MKRLRYAIFSGVLVLAIGLSALIYMNWKKMSLLERAIGIPRIKADLEAGNVFLAEEKEGNVLWELKARMAESFRKDNQTLLKDLKVKLYNQGGRVLTLTGDRGKINEQTRDIQIEGGIVVTSTDGLCLKTQSLRYNHSQREITTDDPVEIDGRGVQTTGVGLRLDLANERISILRDVKTFIREIPSDTG